MRVILVTDFPARFIDDTVLPELQHRVEVVLVVNHRRVESLDLASYRLDLVLQMKELTGHNESSVLAKACRAAGIPVKPLSRKKAQWGFLPASR